MPSLIYRIMQYLPVMCCLAHVLEFETIWGYTLQHIVVLNVYNIQDES